MGEAQPKPRPGIDDVVECPMWANGSIVWVRCLVVAREQRSDGPVRFRVRRDPYDNRGPLSWWVVDTWRWPVAAETC